MSKKARFWNFLDCNWRLQVPLSGSTRFVSLDKGICQSWRRPPPHCSWPLLWGADRLFFCKFLNPVYIKPKGLVLQRQLVLELHSWASEHCSRGEPQHRLPVSRASNLTLTAKNYEHIPFFWGPGTEARSVAAARRRLGKCTLASCYDCDNQTWKLGIQLEQEIRLMK